MAKFKDSNIILQDDQFMYFNAGTISGTGDIYCDNLYSSGIDPNYILQNFGVGTDNIIGGDGAGATLSGTAYDNTVLGTDAFSNATIAYRSVVLGKLAGEDVTTGAYNVLVGQRAGQHLTDESDNTFIGAQAGREGSGSRNTAIGYRSGFGVAGKSRTECVSVGYSAGRFVGNTSSEIIVTAVGSYSGYWTEGDANTYIGYKAGYSVTTGSGNVFLGHHAGYNETTGSNKLYIENSDSASPLIYGEFDNDLVRINGDLDTTGNFTVSGTTDIYGHMAVGNDADLDFPGFPTYEILLNMQETFGASIVGAYGINLYTYGTADNASAVMRGINANTAYKGSGQFNNIRGVYSASHTDVDNVTGNDIHGIYGSAYIAGDNTTITNIIGGYFSAGAVSAMVTATGTNVVAGQFRSLATGSGDFNVTNTYGVQILTPGATYNGTLTNLYGLYIEDMTASSMTFTNEYNIYSAGATSKNYFEGDINFDGTVSGTGDIYCNDLYASGGISVAGDISFIGSGSGMIYGEIFANNVSGTVTITSSGKSNRVQIDTFDSNGLSNGNITPDHTNDHITIGVDGHYMLTCSISCENSPGLGATYGFSAYKNNGSTEFTNCHAHRAMAGAGGDTGSISMNGIIACYVNDTIEIWMWNEDNTNNVIVGDITLSLVQIGGIEPL